MQEGSWLRVCTQRKQEFLKDQLAGGTGNHKASMRPGTSCKRVPRSDTQCGQPQCTEWLSLAGEWADSLKYQLVDVCSVSCCERHCRGREAETCGGRESVTWAWCLQQQSSPSTGATKVSLRLTFCFQLCLLSLNPLTLGREEAGAEMVSCLAQLNENPRLVDTQVPGVLT